MAGGQRLGGRLRYGQVAFDQTAGGDQLRQAVIARDEVTVLVGGQQRHPADVVIVQFDAQHIASLSLEHGPGGHAANRLTVCSKCRIGQQLASGHGPAVHQHIFAQEHLVRGMRAVGLVLVDERRGQVGMLAVLIDAGAGHHHEVGLRRGRVVQRVVRLQRNEDKAVATLGHQVQAMVEELAEEGEPGVEAGRKPFVRRSIGDK